MRLTPNLDQKTSWDLGRELLMAHVQADCASMYQHMYQQPARRSGPKRAAAAASVKQRNGSVDRSFEYIQSTYVHVSILAIRTR